MRNCSVNSAATMTCCGATISMQCASDGPRSWVLMSETTPPTLRDAEPDRHIFRPVRHHQADGLAFGEILIERPARVAVGALGKRAIGQRARAAEISACASPRLCASSSITCGKRRCGLPAIGAVASSARTQSRSAVSLPAAARVARSVSMQRHGRMIAQQSECFASTLDKILAIKNRECADACAAAIRAKRLTLFLRIRAGSRCSPVTATDKKPKSPSYRCMFLTGGGTA